MVRCPLRTGVPFDCYEDDCRWWDLANSACIILTIGLLKGEPGIVDKLDSIIGKLDEIVQEIDELSKGKDKK